ncbi:MAG: hypothetical protein JXR73_07255 [Candidatus Omnitrophica bacterium]|nr:hypothetical protein [Candidatus Omnitrophota bacterium]
MYGARVVFYIFLGVIVMSVLCLMFDINLFSYIFKSIFEIMGVVIDFVIDVVRLIIDLFTPGG